MLGDALYMLKPMFTRSPRPRVKRMQYKLNIPTNWKIFPVISVGQPDTTISISASLFAGP